MHYPITIEFTDTVPTIDSDASGSVLVSDPDIKVYSESKVETSVRWIYGGSTPEWQTEHPTYLIGIVIEKPSPAPRGMPGVGKLFEAVDPSSRFLSAIWAGPSGAPNQDSAHLFLSHAGDWTLRIQGDVLFGSSGGGEGAVYRFPYRIYFFSAGIGTWFIDPELDIMPESGPPPDPSGGG